jgi:hypothetical protein
MTVYLKVRLRHIVVNSQARILKLEQVQLSKVILPYPTAQLQECGCFTQYFFDARHSWRVTNEEQDRDRRV